MEKEGSKLDPWAKIRRVDESDDDHVWAHEGISLTEALDLEWDRSPHCAMEALEYAAVVFPWEMAKVLVRDSTIAWTRKANYAWTAGASADHCFLSALLLTGNGDLVHPEHLTACREVVLRKALRPMERMRDSRLKLELLRSACDTQPPIPVAVYQPPSSVIDFALSPSTGDRGLWKEVWEDKVLLAISVNIYLIPIAIILVCHYSECLRFP